MGNMYVQNITINVREPELKKIKEKKVKEQPIWMTNSTVHEVPPELSESFREYWRKMWGEGLVAGNHTLIWYKDWVKLEFGVTFSTTSIMWTLESEGTLQGPTLTQYCS